jgi:hypothetical protein
MWFGTILYVHLLLKPAYASHGLPRGELIVGWGSIALIAVTGRFSRSIGSQQGMFSSTPASVSS